MREYEWSDWKGLKCLSADTRAACEDYDNKGTIFLFVYLFIFLFGIAALFSK